MKRAIIATLTAAAAAFTSTMAHGQLPDGADWRDLDLRPTTGREGIVLYSVETLSSASNRTITVDGVTYYATHATQRQQLTSSAGVRGIGGRQLFARYELENMVYFHASRYPIETAMYRPTRRFSPEAGGDNGSTWAVLSAPAGITFSSTQAILSDVYLAYRADMPGTITYTAYLDLGDAIQRRNPLFTEKRTVVFPVRSLKDEVYPGMVTATVASNFTQLAAAGANAIGTLNIAVGDDRDGYTHYSGLEFGTGYVWPIDELSDIAQAGNPATGRGSLVHFRGDFSVGSFYANTAATASDASCGTVQLTTRGQDNAALDKVSVAAADGVTSFCIAVPASNAAEIPEGEYTVEVDYEGLPNRALPPLDMAETSIGRIRRDGTRVQIPFLTTYSGYTQRVVIVNRNTKPVSYAFSFNTEDGVTATPGEAAEGTVPRSSKLVLKARDIVSLEGGKTRTAATLDVVATSGTIDVATTTMNMEDKGTDTVVFESVAN